MLLTHPFVEVVDHERTESVGTATSLDENSIQSLPSDENALNDSRSAPARMELARYLISGDATAPTVRAIAAMAMYFHMDNQLQASRANVRIARRPISSGEQTGRDFGAAAATMHNGPL